MQCPHAYRGYASSALGRWANWEYAVFFATGMVSLDAHRAGITVGTMSLIRRAALEEAGGWAEWCLTEDSELAVRIHALGYQSVYLTEPYGRGLIPETFEGYRTGLTTAPPAPAGSARVCNSCVGSSPMGYRKLCRNRW